MSNYTSDATLPMNFICVKVEDNNLPLSKYIPNCKVRFIESESLIDAEIKSNKFMEGKYVLSVDIIPAGINYITKILYF